MAEEILGSINRSTAQTGVWSSSPDRYTLGSSAGWAFGFAWRAERVRDGSSVFLRVNLRPMEELAYWWVQSAVRRASVGVTVTCNGRSDSKRAYFEWGGEDESNRWNGSEIGPHGSSSSVTTYDRIESSAGVMYQSLVFDGVGYGDVSIRIDGADFDGRGPSGDINGITADGEPLRINGNVHAPITTATMPTVYREPSTPTLAPSSAASSDGVLGMTYTVGGASSDRSDETFCTGCRLEAVYIGENDLGHSSWSDPMVKGRMPVKDGTCKIVLAENGVVPYLLRVSLTSATGSTVSSAPVAVFPPNMPVSDMSVERFGNRGASVSWNPPRSSGSYKTVVEVDGSRKATLGMDASSWQSASLWPGDGVKTSKEFSVFTLSTSEGYGGYLKPAGVTAVMEGYASMRATARLSNGGNPPDPPLSVSADNVRGGKATETCDVTVSFEKQPSPTPRESVEVCLAGDWSRSESRSCPEWASGNDVFSLDASVSTGLRYRACARMCSENGTSKESASGYVYGRSAAPKSVEVRRDGFGVSVWAEFSKASSKSMEPYAQEWSCSLDGDVFTGDVEYGESIKLASKVAQDGSALLLGDVSATVLTYPADKGGGPWDSDAASGFASGAIGPVRNLSVVQTYGGGSTFEASWDRPLGDTGSMGVSYEVSTVYGGVSHGVASEASYGDDGREHVGFDDVYRGTAQVEVVAVRNGHRSEPSRAAYLYQPIELEAPQITGASTVDGVTYRLSVEPAIGGTPITSPDGSGYRYVVYAGASQDASQDPPASSVIASPALADGGISVAVTSPKTVYYRVAAVDAAGYMSDLSEPYGIRMGTPGTGVLVYGAADVLISECIVEGSPTSVSALGGSKVSVRDCVLERKSGVVPDANRYYNTDDASSISEDGVSWRLVEA